MEKRQTTEKMDLSEWRRFEGNGNKQLPYSGQRPEGMEEDCIRRQVHNGL
jgi:hypothetical protein